MADHSISDKLNTALAALYEVERLMKARDWHESWQHEAAGLHDKLASLRDRAESAELLVMDTSLHTDYPPTPPTAD